MNKGFLLVLIIVLSFACATEGKSDKNKTLQAKEDMEKAPALAPLSKEPAVAIHQIMDAMGGKERWDELNYVSWTFFGARHLIWDKLNNRVRIDSPRDSSVFVLDMNTSKGHYWKAGVELLHEDEKQEMMVRAKSIWINDMYWLFMPFKLNDPGVNMRYLRHDSLDNGHPCSVFSLTFEDVGDTPDNKYEIFIDHTDHLLKQWSFYENHSDKSPEAIWPWDNYQSFNGLLLSGERSDEGGPSNIRLYEHLDDENFESLEAIVYY